MSKSTWMRLIGMIVFIAGGAVFLVTGAELMNPKNLVPWVGAFIMILGMGLSMGSNLVRQVEHMNSLKRPPQKPDAPTR